MGYLECSFLKSSIGIQKYLISLILSCCFDLQKTDTSPNVLYYNALVLSQTDILFYRLQLGDKKYKEQSKELDGTASSTSKAQSSTADKNSMACKKEDKFKPISGSVYLCTLRRVIQTNQQKDHTILQVK